jgi:glycogen synthase
MTTSGGVSRVFVDHPLYRGGSTALAGMPGAAPHWPGGVMSTYVHPGEDAGSGPGAGPDLAAAASVLCQAALAAPLLLWGEPGGLSDESDAGDRSSSSSSSSSRTGNTEKARRAAEEERLLLGLLALPTSGGSEAGAGDAAVSSRDAAPTTTTQLLTPAEEGSGDANSSARAAAVSGIARLLADAAESQRTALARHVRYPQQLLDGLAQPVLLGTGGSGADTRWAACDPLLLPEQQHQQQQGSSARAPHAAHGAGAGASPLLFVANDWPCGVLPLWLQTYQEAAAVEDGDAGADGITQSPQAAPGATSWSEAADEALAAAGYDSHSAFCPARAAQLAAALAHGDVPAARLPVLAAAQVKLEGLLAEEAALGAAIEALRAAAPAGIGAGAVQDSAARSAAGRVVAAVGDEQQQQQKRQQQIRQQRLQQHKQQQRHKQQRQQQQEEEDGEDEQEGAVGNQESVEAPTAPAPLAILTAAAADDDGAGDARSAAAEAAAAARRQRRHARQLGLLQPLLGRQLAGARVAFALHNAAFQGIFPGLASFERLGLPRHMLAAAVQRQTISSTSTSAAASSVSPPPSQLAMLGAVLQRLTGAGRGVAAGAAPGDSRGPASQHGLLSALQRMMRWGGSAEVGGGSGSSSGGSTAGVPQKQLQQQQRARPSQDEGAAAAALSSAANSSSVTDRIAVNWLRAGVSASDVAVTVSRGYAAELLAGGGCGTAAAAGSAAAPSIAGLAAARRLRGILNGLDTRAWDPATDPLLPVAVRYDAAGAARGKAAAKALLQSRLGLRVDPCAPLFAFVGRLSNQKGADVLLAAMPRLLAVGCGCPGPGPPVLPVPGGPGSPQVVLLGAGGVWEEEALAGLAAHYPGAALGVPAFNEPLAHLLLAAADVLLLPSRYEPCGLVALAALRYGTLPLAPAVGGLADVLHDGVAYLLPGPPGPEGDAAALRSAADALVLTAAVAVAEYGTPVAAARRAAAMAVDVSWEQPAAEWEQLLTELAAGGSATARLP